MKKIFALFFLASTSCLFSVKAIAEDVCFQMPGHWSGMFLLKDESLCKKIMVVRTTYLQMLRPCMVCIMSCILRHRLAKTIKAYSCVKMV